MGSPENDFRADIFLYKNTLFNTHMTFITSQHAFMYSSSRYNPLFTAIIDIMCASDQYSMSTALDCNKINSSQVTVTGFN